MEKKKIGVIGVGNMGGAIVAGIVKSGYTKPANLFVSDRNPDVLKDIKKSGVQVSADNQYIVRNADMIIVAVKPWHIESHNHIPECIFGIVCATQHPQIWIYNFYQMLKAFYHIILSRGFVQHIKLCTVNVCFSFS